MPEQIEAPYRKGYDYGIGITASSGGPGNLAIVGQPSGVEGAGGTTTDFSLSRIQTTEDLETQLGISAEASGGVGLFSASARFGFAKQCKIQSSSLVLTVICTKRFGFRQIDNPVLSEAASKLVDPAEFQRRYGDSFVRGIATGGFFIGVIRIDAQSETSKETIIAELKGSYGGVFSADVAMNVSTAAANTQSSIEVKCYTEGGDIQVHGRPDSPAAILETFDEWLSTLNAKPVPYSVTLAPFSIAEGGSEAPNRVDLEHQRDVLVRCAKLRSQTLDRINLLDYMLDPMHDQEFEAVAGGPDLRALSGGLARDLDMIADAASFALNNPKDAMEPETYATQKVAGYLFTALPPTLPNHKGALVSVPDFSTCESAGKVSQKAADANLTVHFVRTKIPKPAGKAYAFNFKAQDPAAHTPIALGATVTIVCEESNSLIFDRGLNKVQPGILRLTLKERYNGGQ